MIICQRIQVNIYFIYKTIIYILSFIDVLVFWMNLLYMYFLSLYNSCIL